ncbi:MAG: Fe-S cluster assembly protein IscX [Rickettsiaceae bacterium]|nr:Fe-S cluster assembly protein IscX [Rickettsiaceae bacterium]
MQWHEFKEIIKALEEHYPEIDVHELSIAGLKDLVIDLPDFEDDPSGVKDSHLKKLKEFWIEFKEQGEDEDFDFEE